MNKFKTEVSLIENDYDIFQLELKIADVNPLVYVSKLILGILFIIISLIWTIHIIIVILIKPEGQPYAYFLNTLFTDLVNKNVAFFATLIYGMFAFYLLWCTMKGNFKFGLRIPFLFTFHPMK